MTVQTGSTLSSNEDLGSATAVRPLALSRASVRVSIPVSTANAEWIAAEIIREEFLHSISTVEPLVVDDDAQAEILLLADFLKFTANYQGRVCAEKILLASVQSFTEAYLSTIDVHTLVANFDSEARKSVLSSYFMALATLEDKLPSEEVPRSPPSALLAAAAKDEASIFGVFGGQGTNEVYFDELRNLYEIYKPYVAPLITKVSTDLLHPLSIKAESDGHSFYSYGLDVASWLDGSAPVPPVEYLASIPVSFPLIGLTQLVQYLSACRSSNLTPGGMRDLLKGATGHSQGIVSAVAIAASECIDSFTENTVKALKWLFFCGLRGQETFPVLAIDPQLVKDSVDGGEGVPSPMLGATGLALDVLEKHIANTNKHLATNCRMAISLYNGPRAFVVTGPARSLYGLVTSLRKIRAPTGLDQSKIPYSQRKAVFSVRFLTVGVPYHSQYLEGVTEKVTEIDLEGEELWEPEDLEIPVYHTENGTDLQDLETSLTKSLCDQIFTLPIHWDKATGFPDTATHAVDFGPGGLSGIGGLTARNLDGRGVRVIIIGEKGKGSTELYSTSAPKYESWWSKKFAPRLVKTSDGTVHIDTPFSRLLGKPPIMVAGMTPTTVKAGFVSAVLKAGFHIELAGGGHYNAKALRSKVAEIQAQIPEGVGLTLNSLYINPRQFGFQLPLWQELRREGVPVEGFCVAAGIPSSEKAAEIIDGLKAAGIRHVSFKPGSVEGIRQVVNIATANSDFPVILQWTGGRAGGHHSCEDFHQPLLQTYAAIRQQPNIALVGGSGFGGAEDVWPYLTGQWSVEQFGVQPMPFDGFLFASRVMVAKEAHTSESVKQLIVAASGVDDKDWEGTYAKETGGILTVNSELGEPIHKIATRGVKLWKEFDDTVFKLPKDKRAAWLAQNKKSVIEKLNRDFAKPWFAQKKDGTVVDTIGEMTYEEVVLRMIRLMFVAHEKRWVDLSLRNLTGDFCRRVEERFAGEMRPSILQSFLELDSPVEFVKKFFNTYPAACEQLVTSEDAAFFLAISQRPGQKPVPFIPVLDADFGVWFKKDSLWAAEDIEAVFDQDPQRVCILQGPVAVKHCVKANEPVKELLGNIDESLKAKLLETYYGGDISKVPVVDYLGASATTKANSVCAENGVSVSADKGHAEYHIGSTVPPLNSWLECLTASSDGWLKALLTSPTVVQGKSYIDNPLRRLFAPRAGQKVVVDAASASITLYGAGRSFGPHPEDFEAVKAQFDASSSKISLTICEERGGVSVPLSLEFLYRPDQGFAPIHEVVEGRTARIKDFYWRLWFGDELSMPKLEARQAFEGPETTVQAAEIERFCSVVRNEGEAFKSARNGKVQAPLDFAIVTGWQAIIQAIFPDTIDGDLLKLVHLSNEFKLVPGATPLLAGDVCKSVARISSVANTDAGKAVKVTGFVTRDGKPIIEVTSAFLYRGRFTDFNQTFDIVEEKDYLVEVNAQSDVAVLQSKEWFQWDNDAKPFQAGTKLIFRVVSELVYHDKASYSSVTVKGHAFIRNQLKELIQVATVDYTADRSFGNPVTAYLQRHGSALDQPVLFENGGYTLTSSASPSVFRAPSTNEPYSKISRDFNPIHVNPYFSDLASLPATITHGMWSSAATRKFVETVAAKGNPDRVLSYNVSFVGMVIPGDELSVNLKHIGMRDGAMVLQVTTTNQRGEKVLEGGAEVAQPTTVYAFTGQGSQEPGMGMELYASSPAARAVWDTADEHLLAVYGFSIIDIVKNNPKTKTIHFGGIKGQAIRERYMTMSYDALDKDGGVKTLPLFSDINIRTPLYTFSHPSGLLFATQFAQIALVVTEKAAFEDMRSKGLVQKGCAFAGHSLGEYSALASIADVLAIPALVDVVFYRGITMQRAVERDSENRSNYAMCAVNPSRIGKSFDDSALREVVDGISSKTGLLLQIVNFNVEGQQYVCAGELVALQTLTNVLNYLKVEKVDIAKLLTKFSPDKVREMLGDITQASFEKAEEKKKAEGFIKLDRGFATIPLPGIDVPFHSRYLWAGVMPFRAYLSKKINAEQLNPDMLVGQYVPNLIAEPFQVSLEYAQRIYDQTSSPTLEKIIANWEEEKWASTSKRQHLAYAILVELLAYQFASPVKWIQTQDIFFSQYGFERFVEIGPGPTLTGMATRTLKAKYEVGDDSVARTRAIYCHAKNPKEIYYQFEDEQEAPEASTSAAEETAAPAAAAAPTAAPVAAPASSGPVAQIPDEPVKALDTLLVIIAQKLKKKVEEIPVTKAIKDLVGGKSTLQNEILGDLQAEFSSAPEKGEELPLDELGAALSAGHAGTLGKYTTGMVSRLVGGKMPGGFNLSSMKSYLGKQWGLGPLRSDAALLLGVTMEPAKRLGSEPEAKAWLDTVAAAYAKQAGISLSSSAASGSGGGSGGAVMNSEEFLKFKAEQEEFAARHVELYMRHLGRDSRAGGQAYDEEKANSLKLQSKLDDIAREHGDTYVQGIMPIFDPLKARHFDSAWNWVRQDALLMFYDIIFGRLTTVDREITARCIAIMNRADPALLAYMQYHIDECDASRGETYKLAKEFGQRLIDNCREVVGHPPMYKDVNFPTAPFTEVTQKGDVVYREVQREDCRKMESYVQQMSGPSATSTGMDVSKLSANLANLWKLVQSQPEISEDQRSRIQNLYDGVVRSLSKAPEMPRPGSPPKSRRSSSQFLRPQIPIRPSAVPEDHVPLLHLKRKIGSHWEYSGNLTSLYLDVLTEIATSGTTFKDKNALLTGVGKGSIGVEIVKGLLSGGARVVITTSRYSRATVQYYQNIYHRYGSDGSALTVVPFNQGSRQDVEALVDYIYSTLAMDLDYILPFAGIPENGREIDGLDDKSELAHRIMLTNLYRLMGAVKTKKASRNFVTRPTQVVLPLSPNHGLFGNDGLYPESKIALENLFTRWSSESWGEYLCLAGAVIGWTRGTGLMGPTNIVAHQLETHGVRTFSPKEMAFNILGLMHPLLFSITQVEPIWADLSGAMDRPDLADLTTRIRKGLLAEGEKRKAISRDNAADYKVVNGQEAERIMQTVEVSPRANLKYDFPVLEDACSLEDLKHLQGMIDLDKVVVLTGFAEVGPWGGSRTRWEMEARGHFTIEGCIEMAWMMGYIKHHNGRLKSGELYVGWVDVKSGEPVSDGEVRKRYEKDILDHSGIRLIEPELFNGYDPLKKTFYQEIQLNHDLEPLEVSEVEARKFKLQHDDKCDIWSQPSGEWFAKLKKGARVIVPKSFAFDRLVAGQIPTGWSAGRYGIPEDIISQVDRTALWALVCTAEALIMSGVTDPYELYQHVHPSEVGSSLGSGMGGTQSIAAMFKDRREEKDVQMDIFQETYINTVAGWVNLLLMSSSGPIKIPVGACATALQSLEIACDTLLSGKAKVMISGGFDDFSEEGSFEFANMKATSNTATEYAMGREPREFSRPTTSTRAGFMEAQGTGVQILMTASTAIKMGATVRGIVAFTSTSTDKAGRSIPAPGRGVLTIARELTPSTPLPLLDINYRSRQLAFRRRQISQWAENEREILEEEAKALTGASSKDFVAARLAHIEEEALRQEKDALATYGMLQGADPRIAPLRRALAVWGLNADDIGVISIHGTSTKANDKNESHVYNDVFKTLQRTPGNAVPVIAQKNLTGHPKGGAAAWMLIGLCQSISTGVVPGNRNADNIDSQLRQFEFLMYPSKTIHTDGIRAGLMTSFGFGQVGGSALLLHPRYLLGALHPAQYETYRRANKVRLLASYKAMSEMMITNSLVKIKEHPPFTPELEGSVLLNPLARVTRDKAGELSFPAKLTKAPSVDLNNLAVVSESLGKSGDSAGVGVDHELISSVPSHNPTFVERNFTANEISYCQSQPNPSASFAARWAGKEAIFKSLGVASKGAAAAMRDIEILPDEAGVPQVRLHGSAKEAADSKKIAKVQVSLSHSETMAVAFAQATY